MRWNSTSRGLKVKKGGFGLELRAQASSGRWGHVDSLRSPCTAEELLLEYGKKEGLNMIWQRHTKLTRGWGGNWECVLSMYKTRFNP